MAKKTNNRTNATSPKSRTGSVAASKTGTVVSAGKGKKSTAAEKSAGSTRTKAVKGAGPKARVASRSKARVRVTHEDISKRAYEIYLQREPHEGSPESDWYRAEEELYSDPGI